MRKPVVKGYSIQDGITQSILSNFMACRQRCLYSLNRWYAPGRSSTQFGSAFHEMLDKIHTRIQQGGDIPPEKLLKTWLSKYRAEQVKEIKDQKSLEALNKNIWVVSAVLPVYVEFYEGTLLKWKWLEVEKTFDVKYKGYRLRGKRDGLYEMGKQKKTLWLMEHKTRSRIDEEKLLLSLSYNFQNLFYILAAEKEKRKKISGCLYNVIRNPGHRQGKNESLRDLAKRIEAEVRKDPEHFFMRYEVSYTEKEKRQFEQELGEILKEYKAWLSGRMATIRNSFNCETPWTCEYIQACGTGSLKTYKQKPKLFEEL